MTSIASSCTLIVYALNCYTFLLFFKEYVPSITSLSSH